MFSFGNKKNISEFSSKLTLIWRSVSVIIYLELEIGLGGLGSDAPLHYCT